MVLDVTALLDGVTDRIPFDFSFMPEQESVVYALFSDITFTSPIAVAGQVKNMAGYMVLYADVRIEYQTNCARCAEPVKGNLCFSFEKDIADSNVSKENDEYLFIENQKLTLDEAVEEQLLLELPSKTLCREDCRGICFKCGKNLNEGDCSCPKSEGDPRLAVLKTLLKGK